MTLLGSQSRLLCTEIWGNVFGYAQKRHIAEENGGLSSNAYKGVTKYSNRPSPQRDVGGTIRLYLFIQWMKKNQL
jgi:hypothetical protein